MVNLSKTPANTQPTLGELTEAHVEDRYRTAVKFLVDSRVIAAAAVDPESMKAAIARDAATELAREQAIDPETRAEIEYMAAHIRLGEVFDTVRNAEAVQKSWSDEHSPFTNGETSDFTKDPRIISMMKVVGPSGRMGTCLVETLNDDGSRILAVQGLSDPPTGDFDDGWTRRDYAVGPTSGTVREEIFFRDSNNANRMTSRPATSRDLTGEDVTNLAATLATYRPVQNGLLHRELPELVGE